MFHVNIEGLNISFSFSHIRDVNLSFPLKLTPKRATTVTDVTLCDLLVNGTEFLGEACCVKGDAFRKDAGRKVSLARALRESKLSKPIRTAIWEKYRNRGVKSEN